MSLVGRRQRHRHQHRRRVPREVRKRRTCGGGGRPSGAKESAARRGGETCARTWRTTHSAAAGWTPGLCRGVTPRPQTMGGSAARPSSRPGRRQPRRGSVPTLGRTPPVGALRGRRVLTRLPRGPD
eukprot:scaffold2580_cov388-Prasinococcus_capsulatus_cf.AAC.21